MLMQTRSKILALLIWAFSSTLWTLCVRERCGARLMLFIDGKVLQMDYLGRCGGCTCVRLDVSTQWFTYLFSLCLNVFCLLSRTTLSPRYVVSQTPINYSSCSSCAHGFVCDSENPRMKPRDLCGVWGNVGLWSHNRHNEWFTLSPPSPFSLC